MTTARPTPARRLAAVGALLVALAALAMSLTVFTQVVPTLVVLLSVAVAVGALWEAVARRGVGRIVALIVAAVAVAVAIVTVLVGGDRSGLLLVVTVVLAVVSVILGRYALAAPEAAAAAAPVGRSVPAAGHPVLIMNPKSGGGKVERFRMVEEAGKRGIEAVVLHQGDDLLQLARDAVGRGADVLGMAGGDGSQAAVAAIAAEHDVPFVCVPVGTRMDFARDLGLDIDDPVKSLSAFGESLERRIDLGRVGDSVFVNNVSMGVYASIVQSDEYRDAKLKTSADMLPDLLGDGALSTLAFTGPDGQEHVGAQVIQVSNNPYELSNLAGFASRARLDTGKLGLLAAKIEGPQQAVEFIALELTRRVRSFSGWMEWQAAGFEVRSDSDIPIAVDGEALMSPSPVRFQIMPGALRIRVPREASGLSAAARAELTPKWSVGGLLDVIRGRELTG